MTEQAGSGRPEAPAGMGAAFRALASTIVPEAAGLDDRGWADLEAVIDRALAARPTRLRRQLRFLVGTTDLLPLVRHGRRFQALQAPERVAFLSAIQDSGIPLFRRGFWGLRTLVLMGYYGRPAAAKEIGYRGELGGWSARKAETTGERGAADEGGQSGPRSGLSRSSGGAAAGTGVRSPLDYDVVIIGSGAGGGTVAAALGDLARGGLRVLVVEQGPRLRDEEFTGRELEMAASLYGDGGAFLTADGSMTLAFGQAYGGSTVVYTGTSLIAPARVIEKWGVAGLEYADVERRSRKYMAQNSVHLLQPEEINDNNRLFVEGCAGAGYRAEQFPLNVRGCRGSSLCNLGCPNAAKQGTNRVQLPAAEADGVEVVTRAEAVRIEEHCVVVRVRPVPPGGKGASSPWQVGSYRVRAGVVVLAGGAIGSTALLLRSGFGDKLPRLGAGFTCHPAHILVAEHPRAITNDVGHPKSYYLDRAAADGYVLETCMYFPFTTAKNMTGFGADHSGFMRAFPRLQQILVLACDRAVPGNRITVDRAGRPVVHYSFTPAVIESMVKATRMSARIFFAAGALRVHAPTADPPRLERSAASRLEELIRARHFLPGKTSVSAAHLMGGCGMGRSAADSVTDASGRVHGAPWLRVADSSLFPDSVEINPYLTVMALADRVVEGVREELGGTAGTASSISN